MRNTKRKTFLVDSLPIDLVYTERSPYKETYGGKLDEVICEGRFLKPRGADPRTVVIFMHPSAVLHHLPFPIGLAEAGIPVLCCASRYERNDTGLIMEKVLLDLGRYIDYAKNILGFERVVLCGWSGGGSLSLFYQAQAEHPDITQTPAGDPVDIISAGLIPADGVIQVAAHASRGHLLLEWIDPSILDEGDPTKRDRNLDLYDPANPNQPRYSSEYLARFRNAQAARLEKIDAWVFDQLDRLRKSGGPDRERAFVVHGTMAAPYWLDSSIYPSDREPNHCYMGNPASVNMIPAGLARYSSLRSWLSQWSFVHSRANGPASARRVTIPSLVIQHSADDGCTPNHTQMIYDGLNSSNKELYVSKGANHYYYGQPELMAQSIEKMQQWITAL
ncbi:alpha/beta hydrolase [Burkholderia metallica]|uniref:alpha/beta hydrolase family protein n=1 Tax=Burkholderia metallica TaxID=488729 RepID=UPI00157B6E93|nr:alpha/beta hydrolase [Burkholderia metallica]NTZ88990.1 alpha/beta hydrolase [Burkholderia metallica]